MALRLDVASRFPAMCFGKLPAFGDFVRHNAGGRDPLAFDQWLQQGLYHARVQLGYAWENSFRRAPSYRFLFSPENSEGFLLGLLQPSHDRGQRCFPFTVALRLDRRYPTELLPLAPVVFDDFLAGATRLARDASAMTLHQISAATEQLDAETIRDYRGVAAAHLTRLGATRVADLRERLWKGDAERVFLLFKNLLEVLAPFRGRNLARLALGLRFPIAADAAHAGDDVSLWTEAALRLMSATGARPFLFWTAPTALEVAPAPASAASLFLFLRQPTARSVMHFLRPDLTSDFICAVDTDGVSDVSRARSALPAGFAASLAAGEMSLAQLLETLGRGLPEVVVSRVLC
jgi:type VI secretion system ImpM family protein